MPGIGRAAVALVLTLPAAAPAGAAGPRPDRIGACVATRIATMGFRLGTPESGPAIVLADASRRSSYDEVPAIASSRGGDPVVTCLVTLPEGCPPGDRRGKRYRTTNRRTGASWVLPDGEHACGGA